MIRSSESKCFRGNRCGQVLIFILFFSVSPCLRAEIFAAVSQEQSQPKAQEQASSTTPDAVIHRVIDAIDKNYLQANRNPLWNITRDRLLAGKYKNSSEAFQGVREQLPFLEDSELNLLTPDEIKAVQAEATGEKIGSGLADFCIDMQLESGRARVVTPLVGSPAMKAGIQPGDVIISINGKPTSDMNHEQVLDSLRAATQEGAKLQVERGEQSVAATLHSSAEKLEAVHSAVERVSGKNIGYIRVAMFTPDVAQKAREGIARLEQSGVEGYVLDLRNNPGGFLNSARDLAGFFVSGTLGYKIRSGNQKEGIETSGKPLTARPVAVLINGGTASAAEFVAGALQGLQRAVVVGMRSYGRGRGQIFIPIEDGYGMQIPSVSLTTPNGQEFKGKGITPDVEMKEPQLPETQLSGPRDRQFLRAVASLTSDQH